MSTKTQRRPPGPPSRDYLLGVGLGKASGPAALAVVERTTTAPEATPHYAVRNLTTWPAGVAYAAVARYAHAVVAALPPGHQCRLLVDAGLGGPVVRTFRQEKPTSWLTPVLLTGAAGAAAGQAEDGWVTAPAGELASGVLVLLQEDRLAFALFDDRDRVVRALRVFGERAAELGQLAGWLPAVEPDAELVFAVAVPLLFGERLGPGFVAPPLVGPRVRNTGGEYRGLYGGRLGPTR